VHLLTNNPDKIRRLGELGIPVDERIALESAIHPDNAFYLFTKAQRMNHLLDLAVVTVPAPNGNGNGKNGSH
jgi:3,4-dihydroxy 2-butanone 4-phosphate synthase/GTP cyclohydrolase II